MPTSLVSVTLGRTPIEINGTMNHIYRLFYLYRNHAMGHVVKEIKSNSSRLLKTISTHYGRFA
ncbi:hypothetical protein HQ34_07900 [Porphyromonas cangingivalis]|nr:hypothetical protein HQ34_07900 [Porphyromonas cangingivalis]